MLTASAKQLRAQLRHYLDQLEQGEAVTIIRNSTVLGTMMPARPAPEKSIGGTYELENHQQVVFRRYRMGSTEDAAIRQLHETALKAAGIFDDSGTFRDFDLDNIDGAYIGQAGDFLVGLINDEIVAMGAYRLSGQEGVAELKRMRVHPDWQGHGIGSRLLVLLEQKAQEQGYTSVVLDTIPNEGHAQKLYESHGYQETHRENTGKFEIAYYRKNFDT